MYIPDYNKPTTDPVTGLATVPPATGFFVATDGKDSNPGTEALPFATLFAAQKAVRAAIAAGVATDLTVKIRGGNYFLSGTLFFDLSDSPPGDYTVTYTNYPGEEPVINGGRLVTGWESYSGKIYRAKIDGSYEFQTLIENGQRARKARTPVDGYATVEASLTDQLRQFKYPAGTLPADVDYSNAQVYIWSGAEDWGQCNWTPSTIPVTSIDTAARTITLDADTVYPIKPGNRFYVQGAKELISRPGDFFLSMAEGYLYYYPRTEPINDQEIIAPTVMKIINIWSPPNRSPVRNIVFQGLTFRGADFVKKDNGWEHAFPNAAISILHGENIVVQYCKLQNIGSSGILLSGESKNNLVYGNLIENYGVHGVYLSGTSTGKVAILRQNRVSNNLIRHGGQLHGVGNGIRIMHSSDNDLSHNVIYDVPNGGIVFIGSPYKYMLPEYDGVALTWDNHWDYKNTRNNIIAFNDISNVLTDAHDCGGIYFWGGGNGNIIQNNRVHDMTSGIGGFAHGLYVDLGTDYQVIKDNIFYGITGNNNDVPVVLEGLYSEFTNNIVINDWPGACLTSFILEGEATGCLTVKRNILYNTIGTGYYQWCDWPGPPSTADMAYRLTESDMNILYGPPDTFQTGFGWSWPASGSAISFEQWQNTYGYDRDSIFADPCFIDFAGHDYTLKDESPALALGFKNIDQSSIGLLPDFPFSID